MDYNGYNIPCKYLLLLIACYYLGISEYVNEPDWLYCIQTWEIFFISKIFISSKSNELQSAILGHSSNDDTNSDEDFDATDSRLVYTTWAGQHQTY